MGYGESNGTLTSNINYLDPAGLATELVNVNKATSLHNNGWLLGLLGGYQAVCNGWLAGLELNVDWNEKYDSQDFALIAGPQPGFGESLGYQGSVRYKHGTSVGLTTRFGYSVTEYLIPYIRLGAEGSRYRLDVTYVAPVALNAGNTAFSGSISESSTKYRFVGGVELEVPLCSLARTGDFLQGLSLRAEYNYHGRHRSLDGQVIAIDSVNAPVANQLYAAKYRSNYNTGKASIVWNFS